ncbi:MAG: hypothetical protein QMD04_02340 [Anaerolineales bacterium]|nr:hypothetical protein [Anaerolineales bacterium]
MRVPPANRLEKLGGEWAEQHSIRINDQWRICTALRLARYFDTSPQFWLGLQAEYDLDITTDKLGNRLEREVRPYALASA